jgi:hypothetical protein
MCLASNNAMQVADREIIQRLKWVRKTRENRVLIKDTTKLENYRMW